MKKALSILMFAILLINGPLNINKSHAGLLAPMLGGTTVLAGVLIAAGVVTASGGVALMAVSKSKANRAYFAAGVTTFIIGTIMVLLPADGSRIEFEEINLDNLPSHISSENAEIYNYWSTPLSLRSRKVSETAQSIILNTTDKNLYDSREEVAELVGNIWSEEFQTMGMTQEDITALKSVLALQFN